MFPTVVPVRDFDPARDAARIDTAIKTKGEGLWRLRAPPAGLSSSERPLLESLSD